MRQERSAPIDWARVKRLAGLPSFEAGTAWLVGAGPGDPGLLTLHALNALAEADVILYDALVDDTILALAAPRTTRVYAGKRSGDGAYQGQTLHISAKTIIDTTAPYELVSKMRASFWVIAPLLARIG